MTSHSNIIATQKTQSHRAPVLLQASKAMQPRRTLLHDCWLRQRDRNECLTKPPRAPCSQGDPISSLSAPLTFIVLERRYPSLNCGYRATFDGDVIVAIEKLLGLTLMRVHSLPVGAGASRWL
jgi:hypothetical protein